MPTKRTPAPKLPTEVQEGIKQRAGNTSDQIRYLYDMRYVPAQIRAILQLRRYQQVRNVIERYKDQKSIPPTKGES